MTVARKVLSAAYVAIVAGAVATPAVAEQTYTECVNYWIDQCNQTLQDTPWYEQPAVGAACAAIIAGCARKAV